MSVIRAAVRSAPVHPLDIMALSLLVAISGFLAEHACCLFGSDADAMHAALALLCGH